MVWRTGSGWSRRIREPRHLGSYEDERVGGHRPPPSTKEFTICDLRFTRQAADGWSQAQLAVRVAKAPTSDVGAPQGRRKVSRFKFQDSSLRKRMRRRRI